MRYIHISARLSTIMMPNGTMQTIVVRPGNTLNIGSNKRKRARFLAKKAAKAERRAAKRVVLPIDQHYEARLAALTKTTKV